MESLRRESNRCLFVVFVASILQLQPSFAFQLAHQQHTFFSRHRLLLQSSSDNNESPRSKPPPKKKKKKAKKFTINTNLVGSISSDGILTDKRKDEPSRPTSTSLGVPTRKRKSSSSSKKNNPLSKKDRQRTANGSIDSSRQTLVASPETEAVQVLEAKRGNKTVTIIRYVSIM